MSFKYITGISDSHVLLLPPPTLYCVMASKSSYMLALNLSGGLVNALNQCTCIEKQKEIILFTPGTGINQTAVYPVSPSVSLKQKDVSSNRSSAWPKQHQKARFLGPHLLVNKKNGTANGLTPCAPLKKGKNLWLKKANHQLNTPTTIFTPRQTKIKPQQLKPHGITNNNILTYEKP